MKRILLFSIVTILFISPCFSYNSINPGTKPNTLNNSGLLFIENRGQITDVLNTPCEDVLFSSQASNANIFFRKNAISYVFNHIEEIPKTLLTNSKQIKLTLPPEHKYTTYRIDFELLDYNKNVEVVATEKAQPYFNYYLSHCPDGLTSVPSFKKIIYKEVYKNIDLVFYENKNNLKYEFIVKPGGNPKDIKFRYDGSKNTVINYDGSLSVSSPFGKIAEGRPYTYQVEKNINHEVQSFFNLKDNIVSFNLGDFDKSQNLVIDPEISWSTFCGGSANDEINGVTTDDAGNIIVCGISSSPNFPTTVGTEQPNYAGSDEMLLVMFDPDGNMIWSTYYGGSSRELFHNLATREDVIWVAGESWGAGLPTTADAFQRNNAGGLADIAIVKFDKKGRRQYATLYGGNDYDASPELVIDSKLNVYVTARVTSSDFPLTSGVRQGQYDACLLKFNNNGKRIFGKIIGGSSDDLGEGIAIDKNDNIAISGYTISQDMPVTNNAFQSGLNGAIDAFLIVCDTNGSIKWGTYFGGSDNDYGSHVIYDKDGNCILNGFSKSNDLYTTTGVGQSSIAGGVDAFITKFDINGKLIWSSFFGGSSDEGYITGDYQKGGVETNSVGDIAISGRTISPDLKASNDAVKKDLTNFDAFIYICDKDGKALWTSYLGGNGDDVGFDIHFDKSDNLVAVGRTNSPDFPIKGNSFQKNLKGDFDGYIVKFGKQKIPVPVDTCLNSFRFDSFKSRSGLNFAGYGQIVDSVARLTSTRVNTSGGLWYNKKLPLAEGFSTRFKFRMMQGSNNNTTDGSFPGADGIAFVIQNSQPSPIGTTGGGMGYADIQNSLAIEFDTFCNDSTQIFNLKDPNGNHIAVQSAGKDYNSAIHSKENCLAMTTQIPQIKPDGTIYYAKIDYNIEEKTMRVWLDQSGNFSSPVLTVKPIDLASLLNLDGGNKAYLGIVAATGEATEVHDILAWSVCLESSETILDTDDGDEAYNYGTAVFPNPIASSSVISYYVTEPSVVVVKIMDVLGREVATLENNYKDKGRHDTRWNSEGYAEGIYFYNISYGDVNMTGKMVVIR